MNKLITVITVLLFSITSTFAQEVTSPKFGKGLIDIKGKDDSFSMNVSARMQYLTSSSWSESDGAYGSPESNTLVRRARLKFSGFAYNPKLTYKLELGLSNRDISGASAFTSNAPRYILDAYVRWNFYKNFILQAGQGKLPGNIERVISSGNLALVDRSLLNSKFNIDRDLGIQFRHHFKLSENFIVKEIFAVSQGEGRNITKGNLGGHQYTSRVEVLPFGNFKSKGDYKGADLDREETPKLLVGVVYDVNNDAVKTRSNMGSYLETNEGFYQTDINTLFFDTHFKYKGFSLMAEYADRDANEPVARNEDNSLTGDVVNIGNATNIQMGYVMPSNIAITGRYTNINFDSIVSSNNKITQYTLGLSKYVAKHKLKVQTDITYEDSVSSTNKIVYRLQFDIHF
ncbi:OprO/OprP family phosphate-selective porin [Candidatus Arcticimaribacter]|nr:porin [Candidatus Arcticimaribacter sp.]MDA9638490.1 OprO/OprP family phosphate-selective porin [Candidatus Arcticimaribacter sp.]